MQIQKQSRRERKKIEARNRIYEAAVRLFEEHGYDGTRVEDITEAADVAVGTFFNHFPSKEAVLTDYHRHYSERMLSYMNTLGDRSVKDRFEATMKWTSNTSRREARIFRIMMRRLILQSDLLRDNAYLVHATFELMEDWIRDGQDQGVVAADLNPALVRSAVSDIWNMSLLKWSGSDKMKHPGRSMLEKLELLWRGVAV